MPPSLCSFISLTFLSLFLGGCTLGTETAKISGTVTVRIPWPDGQGGIRPQNIPISGLKSLQEVRGDYARFVFSPKINDGGLSGETPHGRFVKTKDNVYVPADEISQNLVTIYAHLERLFALDQISGFSGLLSWPRAVGVSTFLRDSTGKLWSDNFFYEAKADALLLVPTKDSVVPLSANPGVLGHEHFHSIFYRLVVSPLLKENRIAETMTGTAHNEAQMSQFLNAETSPTLKETPPETLQWERQRRTVFLKGLNEGLADVWGWIYSGDPEFITASLPKFSVERTLRVVESAAPKLMSNAEFSNQFYVRMTSAVDKNESLNRFSYTIGTQVARALRGIFLGSEQDLSAEGQFVRQKLAVRLMKALPLITDYLRTAEVYHQSEKVLDVKSVLEVITSAGEMTASQQAASQFWLGKKP